MARVSVSLAVVGTVPAQGNAGLFSNKGHVADVTQTVASTTVAANIATLVADGASPTQAHVTTLNTNWALLLAGLPGIPPNADVIISYNTTNVVSKNILNRAIADLIHLVNSAGDLT